MKRRQIVMLALAFLLAVAASYLWNRWLEHDIAHDIAPAQGQSK